MPKHINSNLQKEKKTVPSDWPNLEKDNPLSLKK